MQFITSVHVHVHVYIYVCSCVLFVWVAFLPALCIFMYMYAAVVRSGVSFITLGALRLRVVAGERRIRVHTLCLPVSSQPSVLYSKLNVQAIAGVLANMG